MPVNPSLLEHPTPLRVLQTALLHKLKPNGTRKKPVVINKFSRVGRAFYSYYLLRMPIESSK